MTSPTPLYYAALAGLTGICFAVGPTVLFAPTETETIHVVAKNAPLVITAEVPHPFAQFVRETIIEQRLATLGVRHAQV